MGIIVVMPPRRGNVLAIERPAREIYHLPTFARISAAEYGRNDTQASTAKTEYFGQTGARAPKVND